MYLRLFGVSRAAPTGRVKPRCLLMAFLLMAAVANAGWGCYDVIDHRCDCSVTKDYCEDVRQHIWTDGCRSCDASIGDNHPKCNREHSWGCFFDAQHGCDCQTSKNECDADAATDRWTHQCWSCCHESVWACYLPDTGCLCGVAQGICARDFATATWSNKCFECLEVDPVPDDVDDADDLEDEEVIARTATIAIYVAVACTSFGVIVSVTVGIVLSCRSKYLVAVPSNQTTVIGVPASADPALAEAAETREVGPGGGAATIVHY